MIAKKRPYYTKSDLYNNVNHLLDCMGIEITKKDYPLNSITIAHEFCNNLTIQIIPFQTTAICGILCKDEVETEITLNSRRDPIMQNFDCMHELIHYFLHDGNAFHCICSESNNINQDKFREWQANEGAAQALVPYQLFIPAYVDLSKQYAKDRWQSISINTELAQIFNVSPKVIENRINNLGYEINQYINGIPLNKITILSNKKLNEMGLKSKGNPQKYHCTKCLSVINEKYDFCHICGINLKENTFFGDFKINKGVGYMRYNGVLIDQNYKATECPKCKNEEIHPDGNFCKICGINLFNKCNGYWENNDWITGCNATLDGSSRYCPFCGKESYFYRENILKAWHEKQNEIIPF